MTELNDFPCLGEGACAHDTPAHSRGGAWGGHVAFAQWLIERTRPGRVVELGVYTGCSFFAFCHASKKLGLNTELIGVDTWKGDPQSGMYGENVWEIVKNIAPQYPAARLARMTFDVAFAAMRTHLAPIDILHIDGFHEYAAVKHDFDTWSPVVGPNGVILLHDTQVGWGTFGVYKLRDELIAGGQFDVFEFKHSFGLGVVRRKGSNVLPELFGAGAARADDIRKYFESGAPR